SFLARFVRLGKCCRKYLKLRYTSGTYVLAQFPPDTAHESESGFPDRYDPDGQYAALKRPGWQEDRTELNQRQTGSYVLLNQFPNTVKSVHHKNLQQNKPQPDHALTSSCLHGT